MMLIREFEELRKVINEVQNELQQEQEANKLPELKEVLKELRVMFPNLFIR